MSIITINMIMNMITVMNMNMINIKNMIMERKVNKKKFILDRRRGEERILNKVTSKLYNLNNK